MSWAVNAVGDREALFHEVARQFDQYSGYVPRDSNNPEHAKRPTAYKISDGEGHPFEYVRDGVLSGEHLSAKGIIFAMLSTRTDTVDDIVYLLEASGHSDGSYGQISVSVRPIKLVRTLVGEAEA